MHGNFGLRICRLLPLGLAFVLGGCSGGDKTTARTPSPWNPVEQRSEKSSVSTVVDGLTGRTAVRSGKRAMTNVIELGEKKQKELDEVLGAR
ncbi:MAG: hypothetical protein ACUVWX_03790 [Kiritimatiellia bacterium]